MTTFIDTTPAASFPITDAAANDAITFTDGPAENGVQTSEVSSTVSGTNLIFANKTAVTFNGSNQADAILLNNPNPAAGLQSLTIGNLGAGSTINGSNPNANSPDVAVAALSLQAGSSIGNTRTLRTQATTLQAAAGTGGPGNLSISNGVATPVTLNVVGLSATNAAGGNLVLTNNGTVNDTTNGIFATGVVSITTNGATADLNTGSGTGIVSNTSNVGLAIGRDINLGDGIGTGSVGAATGIIGTAGGNFTMNANATVTNTTSGNIFLSAGGNFTMLTSPGSLGNAPEVLNNAAGGTISLGAGSGHTLTVDSTGASAVLTNNGSITLSADAMVINKNVNSGTARTNLATATAGQAISLGGGNAPGVLGLTQAELNRVVAGVVQVGSATTGNITIASPITNLANSNTLTLINSGSVSQKLFGSLGSPNLRVSSIGSVTLNNPNNNIQVIAADALNGVTIVDGTHNLTVGTVDGDQGIATTNSPINVTADNINIVAPVTAGTGIVTLAPFTSTQQIALGGADAPTTLGLGDPELGQITASVLRVDAINGNIAVSGAISRHPGYNTLSLATGGSISQTAALSVANLALYTVNGITLTNSGNAVDTLVFANFGGAVSFTNASASPLNIGAVDDITQSSNLGGTTTISTGANLNLSTGLSSAGTATLTSTSGAIVNNFGTNVAVTAPTLVLSASAGIGLPSPLQTQVGTLNALTATGGIFINNGNAAPATLNIGNGSGGVKVTGASGDVVLTNNGTIDVLNNGDTIRGPGNVTVKALGASADLNTGGQTLLLPISSLGSGLVDVEAGRDVTLGNNAGFGDVKSTAGSVIVKAGRNVTLNSNTFIDVGSGNGSLAVTAGGNIKMNALAGDEIFTAGGSLALTTGAGGTLTIDSTSATPVFSNGGNIALSADAMVLNKGVSATSSGNVLLQPVTAGQLISLGTASGGLNLTSAELNLVTAKNLTIGNASAGAVTLGGNVKPTNATNLTITTGGNFAATAGSGLGATGGTVTINFGQNGLGDTADLTNVAFSSPNNVIGGAGNDTFIPNASTTSTFTGGGGADTFQGTGAQLNLDTITDISSADKIVITNGNLAHFSFSLNGTTLSFDPDTSVSATNDTLTLSNAPTGRFIATADPVAGVDLTYVAPPPNDVDGDGKSDIVLQNDDGTVGVWEMSGLNVSATGVVSDPGPSWHAIGTGDFNGDGKADILLQNSDGTVGIWLMNGFNMIGAGVVSNPGPSWHVIGTGDFNGDGKSDILLQNTAGPVGIWEMNGLNTIATGVVADPGPTWHAIGTGDFNGDGKSDILLQNTAGPVGIWEMSGLNTIATGVVADPGPTWHAIGTGDFNGDGNADVLLQNDSGLVGFWEMRGTSMIAAGNPPQVPPSTTHLLGGADFNGDGLSDVFFQDSGGQVSAWQMNGLTVSQTANQFNPGTSWHAIP